MEELERDLTEFGEKNATQIMIFFPHCMWAENNYQIDAIFADTSLVKTCKRENHLIQRYLDKLTI